MTYAKFRTGLLCLLDAPESLCRGNYFNPTTGAHCLVGAITRVLGLDPAVDAEVTRVERTNIEKLFGIDGSAIDWSDNHGYWDVVDLIQALPNTDEKIPLNLHRPVACPISNSCPGVLEYVLPPVR